MYCVGCTAQARGSAACWCQLSSLDARLGALPPENVLYWTVRHLSAVYECNTRRMMMNDVTTTVYRLRVTRPSRAERRRRKTAVKRYRGAGTHTVTVP